MEQLSIKPRAEDRTGSTKLVFKGTSVKSLLASVRKPQQGSGSWQPGDRAPDQQPQDGASPSQGEGAAAVSDSPGRPFSPSSAELSPVVAQAHMQSQQAPWTGPRSVHAQPPGKQPYPDDRTPEAEAARAQLQQPEGTEGEAPAADVKAEEQDGAAAPAGAAAAAAAGPRSVHGQPPGKQPHPDDPAFGAPPGAAAGQASEGNGAEEDGAGGGSEGGMPQHRGSVYGAPPGKQPHQIQAIAQTYVPQEEEGEEEEGLGEHEEQHAAAAHAGLASVPPHAPWRRQQYGVQPGSPQQVAAAAAGAPATQQAYAPAPAVSSQQQAGASRRRSAPASGAGGGGAGERPASRKRPASQPAGEGGGQRKKAANGAAAAGGGSSLQRLPTGMSTSGGVPASLARGGAAGAGGVQIRPMPGAPRSLQQRQQLMNGVTAGAPRPAGASRPKQPSGAAAAAAKPKQQSKGGGSSHKKGGSSGAGGSVAAAAAAQQYKPGDVVWAKIGVYPWWPAQLQRPTAEEHFKPKHAASDLFCVFYGSNDYNWLPPSALKPFTETHPDYMKHASIKNKALQKAIDEAWVFGVQRQRPDLNYGPGYSRV